MSYRVLVVDDDTKIAGSVRRALSYEGYDVDIAHDGREALAAIADHPPDLVVLDVMMPGLDGTGVVQKLRAAGDQVAVLMLTARDGVRDRVTGLEAGADDYLTKPFAYEELIARVAALLRRTRPQDEGVLRFEALTMDVPAMEVRWDSELIDLTMLEFRLLEYFLINPRIVLSRSRILEAVWDLDAETSSNVVDVYIRYIRQKLDAAGAPPLIQTVRGAGYVLRKS